MYYSVSYTVIITKINTMQAIDLASLVKLPETLSLKTNGNLKKPVEHQK